MLYAIGFIRRDICKYFPICLKTDRVVFVKIGAFVLCFSFFCLQTQNNNNVLKNLGKKFENFLLCYIELKLIGLG